VESIQERLSARAVYGEPVTANGITVIPVASVRFGFGGGGGGGSGSEPAETPGEAVKAGTGGGGGGGGGAKVEPMGFIEISDAGARWVPLEPPRAEMALRALTTAVVLIPGGGRRGLIGRLLLALTGQALVGRLFRPQLPPMPGRFRLESGEAE
jgi:uncharacterized spore protein YtfJ